MHGWGDLQDELRRLSLRGDSDAMGSLIDDEILDAFAVVAPIDDLAAKLRSRCDGAIDRVLLGLPKTLSAVRSPGYCAVAHAVSFSTALAANSVDWQRLAVRGVVLAVAAEQHQGCRPRHPWPHEKSTR